MLVRGVLHIAGAVSCPMQLHGSANRGQVVPRGLHRPNLVAIRTRVLRGVRFRSDIDDYGLSVREQDEVADIVVIMAFAVVPAFGRHR